MAAAAGRTPLSMAYDAMLEEDGRGLLYVPILNYSDGDLEPAREMLLHPRSAAGLGDGGAHCGVICDASQPTFMITHWTRDRTRGDRLPLEWMVKKQTHDTARLYGLADRGTIEVGAVADMNLIDYEHLQMGNPTVVNDLPAGGSRLLQEATGYVETIKSGVTTFCDGQETGARPGTLVAGRPLTGSPVGSGVPIGSVRFDRGRCPSIGVRARRRPPARADPASPMRASCDPLRLHLLVHPVLDDEGQRGHEPGRHHQQDPPQPPVGPAGQIGRGHQVDQVEVPVDGGHDLLGQLHLGPEGLEDDHDEQTRGGRCPR